MELKGGKRILRKVAIAAAFLFCAAVLAFATHCWNTEAGREWQADSEDLVWGRILEIQQGENHGGGFLGRYLPKGESGYMKEVFLQGAAEGEWNAYTHQSGLQGTLYGMANLILKAFVPQTNIRWAMLRFANSVLYIAGMLLLCRWIWKKTGFAAALAGFSCVLLVEYSTKTMPNLYWVTWTLLLPFLVATAVCGWVRRDKKHAVLGAALIGGAVLLRCLCGFEFISGVMIAAELPVLFELLCAEKEQRIFWFKWALMVAAFQLAAFALSFGIWLIQDFFYLQDWALVKEDILATIAKRTGAFSEWVPDNEAYIKSLEDPRLNVLKWYLEEKQYLNMLSILDLMKWTLISYIPLLIHGVYKKKASQELIRQGRWLIFAFASVLGPASWYVLASGHSSIHKIVNGVLWLFPTLPLLLAAIGGNIAAADAVLRKGEL